MDQEVSKLKKRLFYDIKGVKIDGLVSISLVGSFQYAKKLEAVNDVDLVVLVEKLTPKVFGQINSKFENIGKRLETSKLKFVVENRTAPIKPLHIKGKKVVQLQLLIYDIELWKNSSTNTKLDWSNFSTPICGKRLRKIKEIKKEHLIKTLENSLSNIKNRTAYGRVFSVFKNKLNIEKLHIKIKKEDYDESITYNIIISCLNYLRFYNPKLKKDKNLILTETRKKLPLKIYSIVEMAFSAKDKIRNGKKLSKDESQKLMEAAIEFIEYLKNKITL